MVGTLGQVWFPVNQQIVSDYVESGDMPPDNPLDEKTVDLFRQWIKWDYSHTKAENSR